MMVCMFISAAVQQQGLSQPLSLYGRCQKYVDIWTTRSQIVDIKVTFHHFGKYIIKGAICKMLPPVKRILWRNRGSISPELLLTAMS